MNFYKKLIFVALFLTFCGSARPARGQVTLYKNTVKISMPFMDDNGKAGQIIASGVPVDKERIVTAAHFCKGVEKITNIPVFVFEFVNENDEISQLIGGIITKIDEKNDLCIISRPLHGIKIPKRATKALQIGEKVFVVGAPYGFYPTTTEGYITIPRTANYPIPDLNNKAIMSTPVAPGNSGGPVFDYYGKLVGIVVMVNPTYAHISFFVPIDIVEDFIR